MPMIDVELPAGIGEGVQIRAGELAGQLAMVIAWRVTRPRFALGGLLDGAPLVSLLAMTEQGEEVWLGEADVTGLGEPSIVSFFLPFTGGDEVLVHPARSLGEVRRWAVTAQRLETIATYGIHLAGTPPGEEIAVDARYLAPRLRDA